MYSPLTMAYLANCQKEEKKEKENQQDKKTSRFESFISILKFIFSGT